MIVNHDSTICAECKNIKSPTARVGDEEEGPDICGQCAWVLLKALEDEGRKK